MDCDLAHQLLPFARPGTTDLDAASAAALDRHLAECPSCSDHARAKRAVDAQLARAMRAVSVPADFRKRLDARLLAARRYWWRKVLLLAGAAGAVLLAGFFGYRYWGRPSLDPTALAQAAYEQSGLSRSDDEARDGVTDWLHALDAKLQAPAEFNYKLLTFYERADFGGLRSVPMLVFARGDATARVFVVRENAFRTLDALADQPAEVGGCTVAGRRYPQSPGWVFVVVTSGAPLDAFLRPARSPVPA
jgi:hypothetical protein